MNVLPFVERIFEKLNERGFAQQWNADMLAERLIYAINNPPGPHPQPVLYVDKESLHRVPNNDMIHEMLRRGFAVMKVPENGKPEALQDV